jgi:hypothetical protein
MSQTYRANLIGNRLEWVGAIPHDLSQERSVPVEVTILALPGGVSDTERGSRMVAALTRIAERGGVEGIQDPVAWERETRQDRPLPGRQN